MPNTQGKKLTAAITAVGGYVPPDKLTNADLEKMVAFVEKLQSIDTTGVEPLLHISDAANVLREDIVQGSITREEALLNSPVKDAEFFKVPKVIKK